MGRPHRYDPDGGWHHTMNRGVDRTNVFRDDTDRVEFLKLLARAAYTTKVTVGAYCLMGNHFHLLVQCPEGGLSRFMWMLSSQYVRHFNDRHGRDGPLYRSRFTSKLVTDERYLAQLPIYIHQNPTDLGFDPTRWKWSSLRSHLDPSSAPKWLATDELKSFIGSPETHLEAVRIPDSASSQLAPADTYHAWRIGEIEKSTQRLCQLVQTFGPQLSPGRQKMACVLAAGRLGFGVSEVAACVGASPATLRSRLRRSVELYESERSFEVIVESVLAEFELGRGAQAA